MKRILALLLVFCMVLPLGFSVTAAEDIQHEYSTYANSGIRHEICTTLNGTGADVYYTGDYTYDNLSELSGDALLEALRILMTQTHTTKTTYNDCHYKANLTDCENGDATSISLIYTSYSALQSDWCNSQTKGWNREHVWPKSLGGFSDDNYTAGSDLHHVRPSDQPVNSARGNKLYGNVSGGTTAKGADYTGNAVGGTYSGNYFEPLDEVKGDVARICLYVYVRYGSEISKCSSITNVFQSIDVLLEWCALDPVDTWEMGRNEVVGAIQGNRNVFIDYPELAWLLFDEQIPTNMTTPSGMAGVTSPATCTHSSTTVKDSVSASCGQDGYTGDTYCSECGELLRTGSTVSATGNHRYGDWTVTKAATATEDGTKEHTCTVCGASETAVIPATGVPDTEPAETEPPTAPSTEPAATEPPEGSAETEPATQPSAAVTEPSAEASEPTESSAPVTEPTDDTEPDDESAELPWFIIVLVIIAGVSILVVVTLDRKK